MTTIENTVATIPRVIASNSGQAVQTRWDSLTKPRGSLGVLETAVTQLAGIQATTMPSVDRRGLYVFCGDHGIASEGVSLYPSVVTREMARNFVRGGAAINVLCRQFDIEPLIVDAGIVGPRLQGVIDRRVGSGTQNFLREPAMSRREAEAAIESGIDLSEDAAARFNLVGVGEMGIGNTTSASAILCAITGATPEQAAGRGTGLDDPSLQHKREILHSALKHHNVNARDPIAVVSAFGGFEIAMMAGFILGAASNRLPVVIDGFIAGAAFLIARSYYPDLADHLFFGHRSAEDAHERMLMEAQAKPLLDLGMRLGEGTGAAIAMNILASAVSLYREMATFAEASVSDIHAKERITT